jgi:hypothetical protein
VYTIHSIQQSTVFIFGFQTCSLFYFYIQYEETRRVQSPLCIGVEQEQSYNRGSSEEIQDCNLGCYCSCIGIVEDLMLKSDGRRSEEEGIVQCILARLV